MSDSPAVPGIEDLPEQMRIRRDKRAELLDSGVEPYPLGSKRTHTLAEIRAAYAELATDTASGDQVTVTGRVMFMRNTGKLCFATLREGDGTELQAMLSLAKVGEERLAAWKHLVDIGDQVEVSGEVISSRRGELSVLADDWAMTSKALRPLPVAHKDMSDEARVRQRYVDLIMRPQAQATVRNRAAAVRSLRDQLHSRGFMEVETPMLQPIHGGASARPFATRSNAFDTDLFLRIAPELYLKRCVVGGLEKVFEINRNFRNEGSDSSHAPEFAMIEAYEAYGNYDTVAALVRDLVQGAARDVFGSTVVTHADGSEYDLGGTWAEVTLFGAISEALGEEVTVSAPYETLKKYADRIELAVDPVWSAGQLAEELFEELVVDKLHAPTFVRDYPEETSPLVRAHRDVPGLTEKWDLYAMGVELGTGYSELVDPVVQRERFVQQARQAARGDDEAMRLDEDFLRAMEYGMPPLGGFGFGIDRLLMTLTGLGIRETILFPMLRPE